MGKRLNTMIKKQWIRYIPNEICPNQTNSLNQRPKEVNFRWVFSENNTMITANE